MKVEVCLYKPEWKDKFNSLHERLWPLIEDIAISIQHVGSTSVVGLCAKDIIDLDIVISSYNEFPQVVEALKKVGYQHRGDLGIAQRESFVHHQPQFAHNLYVCIEGSTALKNHLTLRDHLRSDTNDCLAYSNLKTELANKFPNDIDSYCESKSQFILNILKLYEFDTKALDQIESSNLVKK